MLQLASMFLSLSFPPLKNDSNYGPSSHHPTHKHTQTHSIDLRSAAGRATAEQVANRSGVSLARSGLRATGVRKDKLELGHAPGPWMELKPSGPGHQSRNAPADQPDDSAHWTKEKTRQRHEVSSEVRQKLHTKAHSESR